MPVGLAVGIGRQTALCPQAGSHPLTVGKFREPGKVLHIRIDCPDPFLAACAVLIHAALHIVSVLTVAAAVTIVRQKISQGHVIMNIFFKHRSCRVFIGCVHCLRVISNRSIRPFSVQGFRVQIVRKPVACGHPAFIPRPSCAYMGMTSLHIPRLVTGFF